MNRLIYYLAVIGMISLFALSGPTLDLLGWNFQGGLTGAMGSGFTKIHPATYIFALALAVASLDRRYWLILRKRWYLAFLFATIVTIARASLISGSNASGGEASAAIVSFGTAALMVPCLRIERRGLERLAIPLRLFFALNSLMAVAERAMHHRFIPSFLDNMSENRSTALLGHPLNGALLTGLLLVNLTTSPRRNVPAPIRIGEIFLGVIGMFAYGGRSALLFLPFIMSASALFSRGQAAGEARITALQRAMPFVLIGLGIALATLPIPFVEATLERFSNDRGSALTRNSAVQILFSLDHRSLMAGLDAYHRQMLMAYYKTQAGIELSWIALIVIFGLPTTLCMAVALPWMLYGLSRHLDRSAMLLGLYFLVITAGSASFSAKSVLIAQLIVMMVVLCQRRVTAPGAARVRPASRPPSLAMNLGLS